MKPLVSVVVATYNGAAFVKETLESLLGQNYEPLEVVVCDDGSTDGTQEIVRSFGDRLKLVCQANGGVSAARNHGASVSSGKLIAFVDQDDLWEPELLTTLVPLLAEHPHWGVVYSDSWILDAAGRRHGRRRTYLDYAQGWVFPRLLHGNFIPIETTLMRKSIFDRVGGFDESLSYLEDFELNLRIARECPIGFHPEPLAGYRIHDSNLSHDIVSILREWARVLEDIQQRIPDLTTGERRMLEREVHQRFGELAWHAIRRGELGEADEWMRKAGESCRWSLRWKVRLPRLLLGALPSGLRMRVLGALPRRKLYGVPR